jgi:hypothetical protein
MTAFVLKVCGSLFVAGAAMLILGLVMLRAGLGASS